MKIDDIESGEYYKGYTDSTKSDKAWIYVKSMTKHSPPGQVEYYEISWDIFLRKGAGSSWSNAPTFLVSPTILIETGNDVPEFRRVADYSELQTESVPLHPMDNTSPKKEEPVKKAWAEGKYPIKENQTAVYCVRCAKPTKEIILFTGFSRYCPDCEG